jgi:hypothetical protein
MRISADVDTFSRTVKAMRSGFFNAPGRLLTVARAGWLAIVVPAYALFIAALPSYFASLHHLYPASAQPFTVQLTAADVHRLQTWHLSLDFYAAAMVCSSFLFQMCYAAIGVVLFWRRSGDRAALHASFALMMLPFAFADVTLQTLPTGWLWLIPVLSALGNASLLSCAYVFPDGQFVPRWSRWLALALFGYWTVVAIFPSWQVDRSHFSLALFVAFSLRVCLKISESRFKIGKEPSASSRDEAKRCG